MPAPPFRHLILMITDTCPLQCAHCCVESGPWRTTAMRLEDAISYLHQARAINPDYYLSITGGEPFTRYGLLRDILREANTLGVESTLVTSAVWCKSEEFTRQRLSELKALGLRLLSVSHDEFHLPWVQPEQVKMCARIGAELGLQVVIGGARTNTSRGAAEMLRDWTERDPAITTYDGSVAPNGRAKLIPLEDLLEEDWQGRNELCPSPCDLLIQPDGTTYPCCSTGGDYSHLVLGNARETPLAGMRARVEGALWFRLINTGGFRQLEEIVRRHRPEVSFPRRYISECHLCQLVFGPGELGDAVRDALAREQQAEEARTRASTALWQQLRVALAGSAGG